MFDPQFIKSGFIKGDKFQKFMKSHLKVSTFEELEVPLKISTTDYWKKEEVVFDKGDLPLAIRASYSIPGLFTPIKIKNKILVDGGAVNPLPFDLIKNLCDISIAVDITSFQPGNLPEMPSTFDSVFTTYQIMQNSIIQQKLKFVQPDIYIKPKIKDVRVFDFAKAESILDQAKPAKKELKRQLEKILSSK